MEKFKEKRIVNILNIIGTCMLVIFLIGIFGMMFSPMFGLGFLAIPVGFICSVLASSISKKGKYTTEFLKYMKDKLQTASTLEDLILIRSEFYDLAVEGSQFCLSFPHDLRNIQREIENKIDILIKFNGN